MLDGGTLAVFLPAAVALILAPGPDTVYVLTRTVERGRRAGVASAAGISVGVVVHTLGAVLGLSVVLRRSAVAFRLVKYLGAVYLVYLGLETIRTPQRFEFAASGGDAPADERAVFLRGVLVNVLNPKVALFFLAFLPQFVTAAESSAPTLLLLGGTYSALTLCYLTVVACFAGGFRRALTANPSVERAVRGIAGAVFVGLGVRLAFR